jgi:hypothetical protein
MAENKINIVIGADIEKLKKGFQDAVKITGASGDKISTATDAMARQIEKDFDRIATSANTKRAVTQLQNLALKVQALGPEFQGMANKIIRSAGQIKDSVGDVSAQIQYFSSDTRRIDAVISGAQGIAGAFAIAEGAAALFGSENEELKKTMQKVQGAIALLNGIQAVQNVLQKESALMTGLVAAGQQLLAIKTFAAASAMNAFKVALIGTGIGAAVVLVASLAGAFSDTASNTKAAIEEQKKYNDELGKLRKEREELEQGEEKYSRNELKRVSQSLKAGQDELKEIQSNFAQRIKDNKDLGIEMLDSDKKTYDGKIKALTLSNETFLVEKLKLEQKIGKIDDQSKSKQIKTAETIASKTLKTKQDNLSSSFDLTISNLKAEESAQLLLAKTEIDKAKIQTDTANLILDEKAKYLVKQEKLRPQEEKNAQLLANNLKIIENEQNQNLDNFINKQGDLKEKDIDDNKKRIQEFYKNEQDKASFIDQANKQELDNLNNYYQLKENAATKDFQNGILTEKQYNIAILQLQLQRAQNTLQALKDAGVTNTAEVEKQILDLQAKLKEGLTGVDDITKKFNESINSAFQSISANGFESIGKSLGDSITKGASFMDAAFQTVLSSIAGFIEAYGKAMIAYGVAKLALNTAFASLNPALAIAAGVALVATASIVRSTEMGGVTAFAEGGIVSGPTLGLMGEYPGASSNPEVIAPLDKLKSLIGGGGDSGGYIAETRFDGRDLFLAVKKYERDSARG